MLQCGPAMRNKLPILSVLREVAEVLRQDPAQPLRFIEVASGTGEHAAFVAQNIPNIVYQPSDPEAEKMESIRAWTESCPGVLPPLHCDVAGLMADEAIVSNVVAPDSKKVDVIICINMIHISPYRCTMELLQMCGRYLRPGGLLFLYGPYKVKGEMVESNVEFDKSLKSRNADWGIRDLEGVEGLAAEEGLVLKRTVEMPANNLSVVFEMMQTK
jgi:SAM-dependent methyltransferase